MLLAVVLLSMLSSCRTYIWTPKGPVGKSGPVKQIIVDKNDSKKLYAATENGGVWVIADYTDETSLWRPLTDDLENLQTRGFDVSKHDPDVMVMGNGLGNLHLSRNGGESWSKINTPNFGYIRKIAIDDALGTILIFNVASQNGLYKIEVRGNGQNPIIHDDRTIDKEILDFVIDRNSETQNVRYYAARNDGVYKSIDYGRTWKNIISVDSTENGMIKIAQPSEEDITVVKIDRKLFSNNNLNGRFDSINRPVDDKFTRANSDISYRNRFGGNTNDWNHAIAINPKIPEEIIFGTFKPFSSNDNGGNWSAIGYGHEDLHDIVYVNDDVLTATDGGVVKLIRNRSGDLVPGHQYLNNGFNTFQFYRIAMTGNNAVGNADHNGIKYTQNLNNDEPTWEDVYYSGYGDNSLENDFVHKDNKNPNRVFVAFDNESLLRLKIPFDNERPDDFTEHHDSILPVKPFTRFVDDSFCTKNGIPYNNCNQYYNNLNYALGTLAQDPRSSSNTMLLSSHDSPNKRINQNDEFLIKISKNANQNPVNGEPTWSISHNNGKIPIVSIAYSPYENGRAYAMDESGKVLLNIDPDSTDTWAVQNTSTIQKGETMRQLIVDRTNENRLVAISNERIFVSADAGSTWVNLPFALSNENKINTIAQHPTNANTVFVGTDRGVYSYKRNRWVKFGKNLPNAPVMQISIEGGSLYAATFGRGLWKCSVNSQRRFVRPAGS